jgi:micrococcal nuclease
MIPLLLGSPPVSFAGQFRVTRVHDGETIRAEGYGVEIVVKLAGIEAPGILQDTEQTNQTLALEAKSCLAEMTLNKVVEIEGHGMDEMNRVLGVLFIHGMNVNLEMIKAGYARVFRGDPPHPLYLLPYLKAEQNAKRARRGMWSNDKDWVDSRHSSAAP